MKIWIIIHTWLHHSNGCSKCTSLENLEIKVNAQECSVSESLEVSKSYLHDIQDLSRMCDFKQNLTRDHGRSKVTSSHNVASFLSFVNHCQHKCFVAFSILYMQPKYYTEYYIYPHTIFYIIVVITLMTLLMNKCCKPHFLAK